MLKKLLVCVSFIFIVFLVSCNNNSSSPQTSATNTTHEKEPVKLTFLCGYVETIDWLKEFSEQFNKLYPHINVECEYQKESLTVFNIMIASGSTPDITTVSSRELLEEGIFLDLTDQTQWWSRMMPGIQESVRDPNSQKCFMVPTNMMAAGIFYNKEIFSELRLKPAATWDEFYSNLLTIKKEKPDIIPYFLGGKDPWVLSHTIDFIATAGIKQSMGESNFKEVLENNRLDELGFDSPDGGIAIWGDCLLKMYKEGLINQNVTTASYYDQISALANGEAALITQGLWAWKEIEEINPNASDFIGFSYLPAILPNTSPSVLYVTDSTFLITSDCKHKEEAMLFLDTLFQAENQKSYSIARKAPSTFIDAQTEWSSLSSDVNDALDSAFKIGWTEPKPMLYDGDQQGRTIQDLFLGKYADGLEFAKDFKMKWENAYRSDD